MAAVYTIAWIIGMVASFFPLQQIIVCLRMPMTSRRLLHWTAMCVASAKRLRAICVISERLVAEGGYWSATLGQRPRNWRLNLAPEPGDIKFYLQWSQKRGLAKGICKILDWNVGSENSSVHRSWCFVAGCSKVNRESAGVKPCIALRLRIGIDSRACDFAFLIRVCSFSKIMTSCVTRFAVVRCQPAFPSCREGRAVSCVYSKLV